MSENIVINSIDEVLPEETIISPLVNNYHSSYCIGYRREKEKLTQANWGRYGVEKVTYFSIAMLDQYHEERGNYNCSLDGNNNYKEGEASEV